jgi:UDP-4-amino-4,6-dideoxy-N-acetyl-beta-L-altrosamine transaminase
MKIKYSQPDICKRDIDSVAQVLKGSSLTQGKKLLEFEKKISSRVNVRYSVGTNSATSSLYIAYKAVGLKKNDILWTSANTFAATANCAIHCGAKVDFIDINPHTLNLCLDSLEKKLKKTKKQKLPNVIVPVHFAGLPCDMLKLYKLKKKYNFKIIEDASHAIGAFYKNSPIGSCKYSDITVFSFHAIKVITTGEGGMSVTNNLEYFRKMQYLRSHGIIPNKKNKNKNEIWNYSQIDLGFNFRLTEFQSALGISQLKKLDKFILKRNKIFNIYNKEFKHTKIITPSKYKHLKSSHHLYVIRLDNFNNTMQKKIFFKMKKLNIELNFHYIPVYLHPYYQKIGFKRKYCPEAEKYFRNALSLPMHTKLTYKMQIKVIKELLNLIKN